MKFIHLSDLHIAVNPQVSAIKGGLERCQKAIADIAARFDDAEFIVVTGDLVADPDEGAYKLVAEAFKALPWPVHFILGNHDDRQMAMAHLPQLGAAAQFSAAAQRGAADGGFAHYARRLSYGVGLFLDTVRPGHPGGQFCQARQHWLNEQLAAYAGEPLFVFMHHAPFATGLVAMDAMGLDAASSQALGDILCRHTGPRHLFMGHYHRAFSGSWRGMPFSCVPSMIVQVGLELRELSKAGTIFEPPQYAVVVADDQRTIVHYHQFASELPWQSLP